jgi:hypothetical protein
MNRIDWVHGYTMWLITLKLTGLVTFNWFWCFAPIVTIITISLFAKLFIKLIELGQKAAQEKINNP